MHIALAISVGPRPHCPERQPVEKTTAPFQWIQLDASQQHQNQNDNTNQAEAATDIWTAAIKATTPNAAEPAKQRDD
jgi:hypothetical protein